MWLIAEYQPVTLFSFRSGVATSSGAKTLFLPTPFAVRTALLDAALRTKGFAAGAVAFDWIKEISIAVRPPVRVVVTNLFTKILKPTRKKEPEEAMDRTIAFREYAHLEGPLAFAFGVPLDTDIMELSALLGQVNYFGKRGSFFQLLAAPYTAEELPEGFVKMDDAYIKDGLIRARNADTFVLGIVQMMDDWGESLTFEKVNVYTDKKIAPVKDRVRKGVLLPYRLVKSSKGFSYYERV
ncbi:MAG: hypothetical protein JRJ03_10370 [Deltaproteobacteria bacterium]|nr:hypothetical protein [Deltaproteobacteria bacterium]